MDHQGATQTDYSQAFAGFDERLLRHMATSIQTAHAANPRCWALSRTTVGSIPLHIHATVVLTIRNGGGDFYGLGTPNDIQPEDLRALAGRDGDDRFVLGSLAVDLFDGAYRSLRAEHDALIADRGGVVKTRPMRAPGHSQGLVDELSRILGVSLPTPLYVSEDPVQESGRVVAANQTSLLPSNYAMLSDEVRAIYDALSDEAKAAVDALPDDLFNDAEGIDQAKWVLEAVRLAHQGSPACWALLGDSEWLALNVSSTHVAGLQPKRRFMVQPDLIDKKALGGSISDFVTGDHYKSGLVMVAVDSSTSAEAVTELERVFRLTVSRLAKGRVGRQGRDHRDDVRVKLALVTGEHVPPPAYLPESAYGLPNGLRLVAGEAGASDDDVPTSKARGGTAPPLHLRAIVSNRLASSGLTYSDHQIAAFYTALQTKAFVILSGISGTGKSKIAQRFAEILPVPDRLALTSSMSPVGGIRLRLRPYMQKYNRFAIPMKYQERFPVPSPGGTWEVPIDIDGQQGSCRVHTSDGTNSRNTWIYLKGRSAHHFRSVNEPVFTLDIEPDDSEGISKVVLISGVGVDNRQESESPGGANHLFLPVRPDWRDGKALIGYHNPLTGEYRRTPFLEFALAAAEDYRAGNRNAFFVILDEMNLAHVEYYFADVLSVIESGRDADGWTAEGIPLDVGEEDADLPEVLRLPPNLYIVGTVNMDETTHPFSPKVLDRAFTIELTDVSFEGYPPVPTDADDGLDDEARQALLEAFTREGRYARIDKAEIRAAVDRHPRLAQDLERLNASLRRYRMHVGYRVFDEVMQFVANAEQNGFFASAEAAFDQAVLMKVLPKFNGSRARLHHPLLDLIHWCRREGVLTPEERGALEAQLNQLATEARSFDAIVPDAEDAEDAWRYPATGRRAALMMQDLAMDGFASFG